MYRVLVVDDENNIRRLVKLALEHVGHEVTVAEDGPAALELFGKGRKYDIVVLDQRMPGMEGLEVLREMRRRQQSACVVMVTAYGTIDLAVEAMKAGARDLLRKPFTAERLRDTINAAARPWAPSGSANCGLVFGSTTINGFRIEFTAGTLKHDADGYSQVFTVQLPDETRVNCTVSLTAVLVELVKVHTDRESFPGADRFWQALCEEVLANYLWQNGAIDDDCHLVGGDLNPGLRRFVDTVLSG
jgi:CheY-like chemotaxis protein